MQVTDSITFDASNNNPTAKVQLYLEGYGGKRRYWSEQITLSNSGWQKVSYDFTYPDFQVYRFGIKIINGDAIFDTPVIYKEPLEGDEWDLGIRVGDFPSDAEQEAAGWLKNRHTPTYEWKKAKETLYDLSNMDSDNFWYEIDEVGRFNVWVDRGSKEISLNLSYPKNITSMVVNTNADNIYNYAKGDGSAEIHQDPVVTGVESSNGAPFTWIEQNSKSMEQYWALAEAVRYDSERTLASLQNDLLSEISTNSALQSVPTISISNNTVEVDQLGLGDMVSVEAIGIPYVQDVNGLYKIMGYDLSVDINGNESLSLTLLTPTENQINTLSFPQLIKNLLNRLHGAR